MKHYRVEKLIGMPIGAVDGDIGKVTDVYFDDAHWAVRYLEVVTDGWLEARNVLISPIGVESLDWKNHVVRTRLTKEQVRASPDIDTRKPVYRQHEAEYASYYGYPDYWAGSLLWGATPFPIMPLAVPPEHLASPSAPAPAPGDPHLRSVQQVIGYHIRALDGSIGRLEGLLLDEQSWALRYVVVGTRNWLPGKHVVIPRQWIKDIDWADRGIKVDVTREMIKDAPEFHATEEFSREHESLLYRHYHRPGYWE